MTEFQKHYSTGIENLEDLDGVRHFIRPMMISLQCSNAVLHQPPCRVNPQLLNYCRFSMGCKGRKFWESIMHNAAARRPHYA